VGIVDLNADAAESLARELRGSGGRALACPTDVSDRGQVDRTIDAVRSEFGPVEILVTSAAISKFTPFTEITLELWERMMAINVTGTFNCIQAVIPDMIRHGWGRVVLVSSSSAQRGSPRMVHYAASKGAVIAMSKSLAVELGKTGVTVNNIAPSSIDTPMLEEARAAGNLPDEQTMVRNIPVGRMGRGEDIAAAAMFLCSEEASFFTGQTVSVNGGSYTT
jgi:2-hydroxycyclohexanecarboxyl-CoA dehydrogenase